MTMPTAARFPARRRQAHDGTQRHLRHLGGAGYAKSLAACAARPRRADLAASRGYPGGARECTRLACHVLHALCNQDAWRAPHLEDRKGRPFSSSVTDGFKR